MQHLFENWDSIKERIESGGEVFLLLDYDGTLTPIVSNQESAILGEKMRDLLASLRDNGGLNIAIISGRKLSQLKRLVGIKDIFYAGNHGLEIRSQINTDKDHRLAQINFVHPEAEKTEPLIYKIGRSLKRRLRLIKGVIVENKGLTLSLHYRLVKDEDVPLVKKIFSEVIKPYIQEKKVKVTSGKRVLEVRPPIDWDKGKAVLQVRELVGHKAFPIYIGDDQTDEDAFRAIRKDGVSIYVGKKRKNSEAKYFLKNIKEVEEFLKRLLYIFSK